MTDWQAVVGRHTARVWQTNPNWQVPKALGAIGDKRAVDPLIDKLKQEPPSPMREVVQEALQRITGKDFGSDAEAWETWWKEEKEEKKET